MNVDLFQKNFSNSFPEERDCSLDGSGAAATCSKFNRLGTLIAVGSTDGRLFIYDFVTKGVVKTWNAHVKPLLSLSWSRNGKRLLSSSVDGSVAVWDVLSTTQPLNRFSFGIGSTTQLALFNPRNEYQVLIYQILLSSGVCSPPVVKNLHSGQETRLVSVGSHRGASSDSVDEPISAAIFDRRGQHIITGSTKGQITVYDARTLKPIVHCRQQGNQQQIKSFAVSRRNDYVVTNSQDRVIRCYRLHDMLGAKPGSTLQPTQRFQDVVNKTLWKCVCTSGDGDYICGGSSKSHSLNIWERSTGTLVKILHGPKGELLSDCQWHPNKPVIISVAASTGNVTVWTQAHVENWSAFAPDFTELEENHKYVEKEGEFDTFDEDASDNEEKREEMDRKKKEDLDVEIDVTTVQAPKYLQSSDEEDLEDFSTDLDNCKSLWFVPVAPEMDGADEESPKPDSRPSSSSAKGSRNSGGGGGSQSKSSTSKARRSK